MDSRISAQNQPGSSPRTLYDSSVSEIARKNFAAGFTHGLGGLIVTMISWVLLYILFTHFILPQMTSTLKQAESLMKIVETMNKGQSNQEELISPQQGSGKSIVIPENLIRQFQEMQQSQ